MKYLAAVKAVDVMIKYQVVPQGNTVILIGE